MNEIKNQELMKKIITNLLLITRRRASESISILMMDSILKTLSKNYDFLHFIQLKTSLSYGEISPQYISIKPDINSVDKDLIRKVIESMIRVICIDLKDKAGAFFIKELKDNLGYAYVSYLIEIGVDLSLLQLEQDYQRNQNIRRKISNKTRGDNKQQSILGYKWDNVSKWEYKNKQCLLYDKKGKIIDALHIEEIIENHIRDLTEEENIIQKQQKKPTLHETHFQLLKMVYTKDITIQDAQNSLNKTKKQIESMVSDLLESEYLAYTSEQIVAITQQGINYLLSSEEKKLEKKP
jgi:hypothetical protein